MTATQHDSDSWSSGSAYDRFMGRWSSLVGREFLAWLAAPPDQVWLDVGCGTGTLTRAILETSRALRIVAIDSSDDLVAFAAETTANPLARFQVGLAQSLDLVTDSVDVAVSGLALNFVPQPERAVSEMLRVVRPGGIVGLYLWDYADGMEMLRYFWDAAVALDSKATAYDEGARFPLCRPQPLVSLVETAGLKQVVLAPIEVTTRFQSFDDYWTPLLGAVGPAPSYTMSLSENDRQRLADELRQTLPRQADGSISLKARSWAVKGIA